MLNRLEGESGFYNQQRECKRVRSPIGSLVDALLLEEMTIVYIADDSTTKPNEPVPHIYKNPVNFSPEIPEEHMCPVRLARMSGFSGS